MKINCTQVEKETKLLPHWVLEYQAIAVGPGPWTALCPYPLPGWLMFSHCLLG